MLITQDFVTLQLLRIGGNLRRTPERKARRLHGFSAFPLGVSSLSAEREFLLSLY